MSTLALPRNTEAGRTPVIPSPVLGMALFLFTEVMLFCGLISAYLVLRAQAGAWPPADQPRLPILLTAFNTVLLLWSGRAMWRSVPLLQGADPVGARRALLVALTLGAAFLAIQGYEWVSLISYGLSSSESLYGALFYTLVGCHALHVAVALGVVAWVLRRASRGPWGAEQVGGLRAVRMYWLFVVAIWPPLYVMVYLW